MEKIISNILYTIISSALVFFFIAPFVDILAAENFHEPETQVEPKVIQHAYDFKQYYDKEKQLF